MGGFLPKGNRVVERRYKTVIWQKDDEHCVSYVVAVAGQNLTAHIEPRMMLCIVRAVEPSCIYIQINIIIQ